LQRGRVVGVPALQLAHLGGERRAAPLAAHLGHGERRDEQADTDGERDDGGGRGRPAGERGERVGEPGDDGGGDAGRGVQWCEGEHGRTPRSDSGAPGGTTRPGGRETTTEPTARRAALRGRGAATRRPGTGPARRLPNQ